MKKITLNDKNTIPQLGFGLYLVPDEQTPEAVGHALEAGYRSLDSAQIYQNEMGLGRALKETKIPRSELFITTKIWNDQQGYDSTLKSFDESMEKLGLTKLDLLLIHWPSSHRGLYVETWKALIELQKQGRVSSIGVSNFTINNLQKILDATGVAPAVNQIELHPHFQQKHLREFHQKHGIHTEAWSPLGQGKILKDQVLLEIAKKHGKSPAQIILAWHLHLGNIAIPKSVTPARILENIQVFNIVLDSEDMQRLEALDDQAGRIGPDPDTAQF